MSTTNPAPVISEMKRIIRETGENKNRLFLDVEWCAHENLVALYCKIMREGVEWIAFRVKNPNDLRVHAEKLCLALKYVYAHTAASGIVILAEDENAVFGPENIAVLVDTWSVSRAQIMSNKYKEDVLPKSTVHDVAVMSRINLLPRGKSENRLFIEFSEPEFEPASAPVSATEPEIDESGVYTGTELIISKPSSFLAGKPKGKQHRLAHMSGRDEKDFDNPQLPISNDKSPYETLILNDRENKKFHYEVEIFTHPDPETMLNKTFADYTYAFVDPSQHAFDEQQGINLNLDNLVRSAIRFANESDEDDTISGNLTQEEKESFDYMYSIDEFIIRVIHMIVKIMPFDPSVELLSDCKNGICDLMVTWALYTVYDHEYIKTARANIISDDGISELQTIFQSLQQIFLHTPIVVSPPDEFPEEKKSLVDYIYEKLESYKKMGEFGMIPFSVARRTIEQAKFFFLDHYVQSISPQIAHLAIEIEPISQIVEFTNTLIFNDQIAAFENAQTNVFQLFAYFRQFVANAVDMRIKYAIGEAMTKMRQRQLCTNLEPRLLDIIMKTRSHSSVDSLNSHAQAAMNELISLYITVNGVRAKTNQHAALIKTLSGIKEVHILKKDFARQEEIFGPFGADNKFEYVSPDETGIFESKAFKEEKFTYVAPIIGLSDSLTNRTMLDIMFYRMLRTMKERVNVRMSMVSEKDTLRIPFAFNTKDRYVGTPSSYHDPFIVMLRERMFNSAISIMARWPKQANDHGQFVRMHWSEIAVSDLDEIYKNNDVVYIQRLSGLDFMNVQFEETTNPPDGYEAPPGYTIKRYGFVLNMSSFQFRDTRRFENSPLLKPEPTLDPWHFMMYPVEEVPDTKYMYTVKRLSNMDEFRTTRFPGVAYMHMAIEVLTRNDPNQPYPAENSRMAHIKHQMHLNLLMPNVLWKTNVSEKDSDPDGRSQDYISPAIYFNQSLENRRYAFAIFCDLFNPNLLDIFSVYHVREYTSVVEKKTKNNPGGISIVPRPFSIMHYSVKRAKVEYSAKDKRSPVIVDLMNVVVGTKKNQIQIAKQILCKTVETTDEQGKKTSRVEFMTLAEQRKKVEELFKDAVFIRAPEIKLLHPRFPKATRYDPRYFNPENDELLFEYNSYYIRMHDWNKFETLHVESYSKEKNDDDEMKE